MEETSKDVPVWTDQEGSESGPDTELAVMLLAAGASQSFVRTKAGFPTQRAVQAFCRDDDVRREVEALAGERVRRLGKRATVCLEEILNTPQTDLRAQVLAIRTALEVSGELRAGAVLPAKSVRELSVGELTELIAATRSELEAREGRQRAGRQPLTLDS